MSLQGQAEVKHSDSSGGMPPKELSQTLTLDRTFGLPDAASFVSFKFLLLALLSALVECFVFVQAATGRKNETRYLNSHSQTAST